MTGRQPPASEHECAYNTPGAGACAECLVEAGAIVPTASDATVPTEAYDETHPDHDAWVGQTGRCMADHEHEQPTASGGVEAAIAKVESHPVRSAQTNEVTGFMLSAGTWREIRASLRAGVQAAREIAEEEGWTRGFEKGLAEPGSEWMKVREADVQAARDEERARWTDWLASTGYGIDYTGGIDPPCTLDNLADAYVRVTGEEDRETWAWTLHEETGIFREARGGAR